MMGNCFKWLEFASTLCSVSSLTGSIDDMVENTDLNGALESYYNEIENSQDYNSDTYAATSKLTTIFKIVAKEDRLMNWRELKQILDLALQREMQIDGLCESTCRSLIALMDKNRLGRIGVKEFIYLWKRLHICKKAFLNNAASTESRLDESETQNALSETGVKINKTVVNAIMVRYGDKQRLIEFEDFLLCAIKIKRLTEIFKQKESSGEINISMAEFVEKTLYC